MRNTTAENENKTTNIDMKKISDYSLCRWLALQEAMELIGDKCEEKNSNFENVELKPLEILKYIDNTADVIYQKNFPNTKVDIYEPDYSLELEDLLS